MACGYSMKRKCKESGKSLELTKSKDSSKNILYLLTLKNTDFMALKRL